MSPAQILDIAENANATAIRRAYRRKALAFHPDRTPAAYQEKAARVFTVIRNAYEALLNSRTPLGTRDVNDNEHIDDDEKDV